MEALKDFSFSFPATGMVFIVGKSGSGKSTLLNILGLLDRFDSGVMKIAGRDVATMSESERDQFRGEGVGFVFQEFYLIEKYTIGQNIALALEVQQEYSRQKVDEVLRRVGLDGYHDRNSAQISGGQKQRVALARAIVKDPALILADEPTGSLDAANGTEIFSLLKSLSDDRLVIVISHDQEAANRYGDQIIELVDGTIASVSRGQGMGETVRLEVEEVAVADIDRFNNLLSQGKKLLITKPVEQVVSTENTIVHKELVTKEIRLRGATKSRLALLSLKSKLVHTFFTILISMVAIALFGFADIVSSFDHLGLLIQELNHENVDFVNIGLQQIERSGAIVDYQRVSFYSPDVVRLNQLSLETYPHYYLPAGTIPMETWSHTNYLPRSQYYEDSITTYIECDQIERLGLTLLEGRLPQEPNEILINTYHMEVYREFGIKVKSQAEFPSVTSFDQIKDVTLPYYWGLRDQPYTLKIVGLVGVDTSKYAPLAQIRQKVSRLDDDTSRLLADFRRNFENFLGAVIVNPGFYQMNLETAAFALGRPTFTMTTGGYQRASTSLGLFHREDFRDYQYSPSNHIVLMDGLNGYDDLQDDHVILSTRMLRNIIPELQDLSYDRYRSSYRQYSFGRKVTLTTSLVGQSREEVTFTKELTIVGLFVDSGNSRGAISANLVAGLDGQMVNDFKVPANSPKDRAAIVKLVDRQREFTENLDQFRFCVRSTNYSEILSINSYFTLFVGIFQILAIILCLFALILTYTLISQSVLLRRKDIGILRSLGVRKRDIAGIFIYEGAIIAILEMILAIVACYIGFNLLDLYFIEELGPLAKVYDILPFSFRSVVLMIISTLVAMTIALFVPIYRISRKQPSEAIRG